MLPFVSFNGFCHLSVLLRVAKRFGVTFEIARFVRKK